MLISATALLISSVSSPPPFTVIEDESHLPLLNPDLNMRKSIKIRLSNGLEALIISDPGADQSAAAVSVGAGSWSDPPEYPGMAHFCEHMLFMGTETYPSENEFFSSVADYAGQTNAFTAPNRTVYMFSAQTSGFLSLFDRFAHFFIDPLFNPANIAREMHAVDQEFAKNIEHDGWREYMVFKETGNQRHPNRMFSTGNSETLAQIPQSALKKWHGEKYGAERMKAVVYSPLPLEELQRVVAETFSHVPKSLGNQIDSSGSLVSSEQIGHISFIKPIQNRKSLTLSWELPPELSADPTRSAEIAAYALRRGQKYSLYENLKEEQWIDSMSVRVDELGGSEHRFFQISLELTQKGIETWDSVVLRCFQAIACLRKEGVPFYLFEEKNTMGELNYQYQSRQNPFDYISRLGDTIGEEPLSTYPRFSILSKHYDPDRIALLGSVLSPQKCMITLLASPDLTKVAPDRREQWLGAEYAIRPIPPRWMKEWEEASPIEQIRIAEPNPFLPQTLSLAPEGPSVPIPIAESDLGIAYYVRSPEFGGPESVYRIHLLSPELDRSPRHSVLASLYIDHLTDLLHPTLAAANSAGLHASFDIERSAIHIEISGYSEKAPLLLQEIARQMPLSPPSEEQFSLYRERHEKGYSNGKKELAVRQAKELLDSIVNRDKSTKQQKLAALKTISYEDFLQFHRKLFETTYIQALFAGNLTLKEAESAWLDIIHALGKSPYPKEDHPQTEILRLPEEGGPYQILQTSQVQGNGAVLFLDQGTFSHEKRGAQEILSSILKEAFFNELRTKQKTGYIAQTDASEIEERLFQYFWVQSNSHQPEELLFRFEQFIEEFNDSLPHNIGKERFEILKESLSSSLKNRFRNLSIKSALWDRLAFEREGDFEFIEKRIEALSSLSYEEFLRQSNLFLNRANRKRLAILFQGKLAAPFEYQPIQPLEIEEIAIYRPKEKKNSADTHSN